MRKTLAEAIRDSELPHKEELIALIRQALYISRDPMNPQSQAVGVSRFGGVPDLPPEYEWPKWQGKSQSFIAQINLAELPDFADRSLLPENGLLYFFYDATREAMGESESQRGSFAVLYTSLPSSCLSPRREPLDLETENIFVPARMTFEVYESLPKTGDSWDRLGIDRLSFREQFYFAEKISAVKSVEYNDFELHQMLGYPSPIQDDIGFDCERALSGYRYADYYAYKDLFDQLKKGAEQWELLLQVISDEKIGMYWPCDSGILYFMIRRSDLAARRFDRAWMIKQYS